MSNADRKESESTWPDAGATERACAGQELKVLLAHIAEQIQDADRRHGTMLLEMNQRMGQLTQEAEAISGNVPAELSQAFERIEDGMAQLAERIETAGLNRNVKTGRAAGAQADQHVGDLFQGRAGPEPMPLRSAVLRSGAADADRPGESHLGSASPAVDTFDIIDTSRPGILDEPWDRESAEALTQLYEHEALSTSRRPGRGPGVHAALPFGAAPASGSADHDALKPGHAGAMDLDRDWLEARFAEISEKVEQSLAEMRLDGSFLAVGHRFNELEERLVSALQAGTSRTDEGSLRLIEAHVSELAEHLERTQAQLARLDIIESQLMMLTEHLSHGPASESSTAPGIDLPGLAAAAAEEVAARFAKARPETSADLERIVAAAAERITQHLGDMTRAQADAGALDELKELIHGFMSETRQGEEHTATMLDTLQQAMIRMLDRIDAIELGHEDVPPLPRTPDYIREQIRFDLEALEEPEIEDIGLPRSSRASDPPDLMALEETAPGAVAPAPEPASAPFAGAGTFSYEESPDRSTSGITSVSREDFVASARRAAQAASRPYEGEAAGDVTPAQAGAMPKAKPVAPRTSQPNTANPSAGGAFGGMPVKVIAGIFGLLVIIQAANLLIPRKPSTPVDPAAATKVDIGGTESASASASAGAHSEAAFPSDEAERATPPSPTDAAETPDGPLPVRPGDKGAEAPAILEDIEPARVAPLPRDTASAAFVPLGVLLQPSRSLTPQELELLGERQRMANLSSEIGAAAARATPASLLTQEERSRIATGSITSSAAPAPAASALDLPPATVGPLSLRLAAAKGDPSAEFEVGARLAEGKGTDQNLVEAARWYQRSAAQGFAQAQYRLASFYERGLGLKADPGRARIWYRRAAEQGNVKAMHNLAVMSAGRREGGPDYAMAAQWFAEAAERGLADSQFNLAVLYENGLGVSKDVVQAVKWYALAARAGDKDAARRREALGSEIAPADRSGAEQLANAWRAKPVDKLANDARAAGEDWKRRESSASNG